MLILAIPDHVALGVLEAIQERGIIAVPSDAGKFRKVKVDFVYETPRDGRRNDSG
jgi:hypothetical protein